MLVQLLGCLLSGRLGSLRRHVREIEVVVHLGMLLGHVHILLLLLLLIRALALQYAIHSLDKVGRFRNGGAHLLVLLVRNGIQLAFPDFVDRSLLVVETEESHTNMVLSLGLHLHQLTVIHDLIIIDRSVQVLVRHIIAINVHGGGRGMTADVVVDWVLNPAEREPSVKHRPAILLVPLSEPWVLVQLGQNFIQTWYCGLLWKTPNFFLH